MMKNVRASVKDAIFCAVSMYGAAWLAFLFAMIPLYIFRGGYHNSANKEMYENLLQSVVGIVLTTVFLTLIYRQRDEMGKKSVREVTVSALIGGGIYGLVWIVSGDSYLISVNGHHLGILLSAQADGSPTFLGTVSGAIISCSLYVVGVLIGSFFARRKRKKELR
ncbi:MAG: hypothetical protein IJW40_02235 [Clostridia bacterium]|nr:hypothetical protein [Clostridia bacterium]